MATVISTEARQDLLGLVSDWCRRHLRPDDLDQAEIWAEQVRQLVGEAVLEANLQGISGKATYRGSHVPCACGAKARFVGYRTRWIKSTCAEIKVARAYYHCAACKRGQVPWDKEQGLSEQLGTARFKASVCRVMGRLPYTEGVSLLSELCGLSLPQSSAEAIVLEVGPRIRAQQEQQVAVVKAQTEQATAQRLWVETGSSQPVTPLATRAVVGKRLYVGTDATTAHIDGGWHNVQNGIVFTVRPDDEGRDTLLERAYVAGRMDMQAWGWQLRTLSALWQESAYAELVFLGDGAPCNWNLADLHFARAVQILDFYHASEHVWALSRAVYRQEDPKQKALGERWVTQRLDSLKRDGPRPLLRALARRRGKTASEQEALRQARHYFASNARRMDYPGHLAAGRMIGSGPVEAACKSVVGMRLKQAGMRWSDAGADAVLAVRTTLLNGDSARLSELARAA